MRILVLQPYYGGSHLAAMEGWMQHSPFEFTVLQLPPRHWKWRMRQSAWQLAHEASARWSAGERWEAVFCTDMLNLAEFKGLVLPDIARLPTVAYFHENQFIYPTRNEDQRDSHFEITNFTTALAADESWFNSSFNRDSMLDALVQRCQDWPDHPPTEQIEQVRNTSRIMRLGVSKPSVKRKPRERSDQPVRIVWAARWEHDKGPGDLLKILRKLREDDCDFRISVIGQSFRKIPAAFAKIESEFSGSIERWGFQPTRQQYWQALAESDVFLSTAEHEFFGLSAVEAIAAGLYPVFPNRLAYPELLSLFTDVNDQFVAHEKKYLYSSVEEASMLIKSIQTDFAPVVSGAQMNRLFWESRAASFDQGIQAVVSNSAGKRV